MNLTRLICLGLLAEHGARHGHQLKQQVKTFKADQWAGVKAGSLHRELRQLADEDLIEVVNVEQVGRWPSRTTYQITAAGRRQLTVLCEQAIGSIQEAPDAVAAGLIFAGTQDPAMIGELLARHRQAVQAELDRLALERERGMRDGYLRPSVSPLQAAAFRRSELHMAAELAWHRECDQLLGARPPDDQGLSSQ